MPVEPQTGAGSLALWFPTFSRSPSRPVLTLSRPLALVVFARYPGSERAFGAGPAAHALAAHLLERTLATARLAAARIGATVVLVGGAPGRRPDGTVRLAQRGRTPGERLQNGLVDVAALGFAHLVVVGSDCPGLTAARLAAAAGGVSAGRPVVGPARDGGFYLWGLVDPGDRTALDGVCWGSARAGADLLAGLRRRYPTVHLLPVEGDLDRPADLRRLTSADGVSAALIRTALRALGPQLHPDRLPAVARRHRLLVRAGLPAPPVLPA